MRKRDIAIKLAEKTGLTQLKSLNAVQDVIDIISEELLSGNRIELRNFGVFEVKTVKARKGRNPNNPSHEVIIPERNVVKFRSGLHFKEKIQNKKI
jgi:nucleoid DNA-binding protein